MNEMVERVARAVWETQNRNQIALWESSLENHPDSMTFRQARAAIAAMRLPTKAMANVAASKISILSVYQAMIDEALRE